MNDDNSQEWRSGTVHEDYGLSLMGCPLIKQALGLKGFTFVSTIPCEGSSKPVRVALAKSVVRELQGSFSVWLLKEGLSEREGTIAISVVDGSHKPEIVDYLDYRGVPEALISKPHQEELKRISEGV